MPGNCSFSDRAQKVCTLVEEHIEQMELTTDELAHFWRHFADRAMFTMLRLNPELAQRVERDA